MIEFRLYRPEDERACIAIARSTVPDYLNEDEIPLFLTFLRGEAQQEHARYEVGVVDNEIRACGGTAIDDAGVAHLCWGLVHQDHHKKGYGQALVQRRLDWLGPAIRIEMDTSQHTVAFYERFGCERTGVFVENGYGLGLHKLGMVRPTR